MAALPNGERIQVHARWPETWWDAFKERWFPQWLLRRFPVSWSEIDVDRPLYQAVCPHTSLESLESLPCHLDWLIEMDQQRRFPEKEGKYN